MNLWRTITVLDNECAVQLIDGKFGRVLAPGRYRLFGDRATILTCVTYWNSVLIGAQEAETKDNGFIRYTVRVFYNVVDAGKHYNAGGNFRKSPNTAQDFYSFAGQNQFERRAIVKIQEIAQSFLAQRTTAEAMLAFDEFKSAIETGLGAWGDLTGIEAHELSVLNYGVAGSLKAAFADRVRAQMEGETAMIRARNEAATMRSLLNTARLVRENPGLLEVRAFAQGQKPKLTFNIGPVPTGTASEKTASEENQKDVD